MDSSRHSEQDIQSALEWLKAEETAATDVMNRTRDGRAWSHYGKQAGRARAAAAVVTGLQEQFGVAEKSLREMHDYLSGIVASGFVGEGDWDDINSWLAKNERYATYAHNPAKERP